MAAVAVVVVVAAVLMVVVVLVLVVVVVVVVLVVVMVVVVMVMVMPMKAVVPTATHLCRREGLLSVHGMAHLPARGVGGVGEDLEPARPFRERPTPPSRQRLVVRPLDLGHATVLEAVATEGLWPEPARGAEEGLVDGVVAHHQHPARRISGLPGVYA